MDKEGGVVGLVGVGMMGLAMSKRLIDHGYEVAGYRRGSLDAFVEIGGKAMNSVAEVANTTNVILTCLPDAGALDEVLSGECGIVANAQDGLVLIEMSSMEPEEKSERADKLLAHGVTLLDCPISGTPQMVSAGKAAIFASGDESTIESHRSMLESIAPSVNYVGKSGAGSTVKFIANALVAIHTLAAAEAFVLAECRGVDSRKLLQALSGGPASSVMLQIRGKIMADHEYEEKIGGIRIFSSLLSKIAQRASEQGDFRLLNTANDEYQEAAAGEYRDYDIAALVEHISDRVEREKKA
jgi:3-hydroxyisobutyrate dehydrogenase